MTSIDDEGLRWLAGSLSWKRTLDRLRDQDANPAVPAHPDPDGEPIALPEPERPPIADRPARVPRRGTRVASQGERVS